MERKVTLLFLSVSVIFYKSLSDSINKVAKNVWLTWPALHFLALLASLLGISTVTLDKSPPCKQAHSHTDTRCESVTQCSSVEWISIPSNLQARAILIPIMDTVIKENIRST